MTIVRGRGYLQVGDEQLELGDGIKLDLREHLHSKDLLSSFVWPNEYAADFLGVFHPERKIHSEPVQVNKNRAKQKARKLARKRTRQNR